MKNNLSINDIFENIRDKYLTKDGDPKEKENPSDIEKSSSEIHELLQDDVDSEEMKKAIKEQKNN